MEPDYTVHLLRTYHVPNVGTDGNIHTVTRVSIMIGHQGPFQQDFGEGQAYADTADNINKWKSDMVTRQMAIAGPSR